MTTFLEKPGFYWDPRFNAELTAEKRKFLAEHERMHLLYANRRGQLTADQVKEAEEAIAAFERGDPPKEPIEGTAVFVFPKATNPRDAATDAAVTRVIKDYVTNKPK